MEGVAAMSNQHPKRFIAIKRIVSKALENGYPITIICPDSKDRILSFGLVHEISTLMA